MLSREEVIATAVKAMFGRRVVTNVLRANLVEAMVSRALESSWQWVSGDWREYDFLHRDGTRLEVKQSAARQSWHSEESAPSRPRFDVAPRKGYWDVTWINAPGRNADIFVFAFNPHVGTDTDHADPLQWEFYPVAAHDLPAPPRRSITLANVRKLTRGTDHHNLNSEISRLHRNLARAK